MFGKNFYLIFSFLLLTIANPRFLQAKQHEKRKEYSIEITHRGVTGYILFNDFVVYRFSKIPWDVETLAKWDVKRYQMNAQEWDIIQADRMKPLKHTFIFNKFMDKKNRNKLKVVIEAKSHRSSKPFISITAKGFTKNEFPAMRGRKKTILHVSKDIVPLIRNFKIYPKQLWPFAWQFGEKMTAADFEEARLVLVTLRLALIRRDKEALAQIFRTKILNDYYLGILPNIKDHTRLKYIHRLVRFRAEEKFSKVPKYLNYTLGADNRLLKITTLEEAEPLVSNHRRFFYYFFKRKGEIRIAF